MLLSFECSCLLVHLFVHSVVFSVARLRACWFDCLPVSWLARLSVCLFVSQIDCLIVCVFVRPFVPLFVRALVVGWYWCLVGGLAPGCLSCLGRLVGWLG